MIYSDGKWRQTHNRCQESSEMDAVHGMWLILQEEGRCVVSGKVGSKRSKIKTGSNGSWYKLLEIGGVELKDYPQ